MKPKNENVQAFKQNHLQNLDDERETQEKNQNDGPIEGEIDAVTESEDTDNHEKENVSSGITAISVDEDEHEKTEEQEQTPAIEVQKTDVEKETAIKAAILSEDKTQEGKIGDQEKIPKVEDETDSEGNDKGEENSKDRRKIGPFLIGIIVATLIISVLFARLIYTERPELETDKAHVSPPPEPVFNTETLFQKKKSDLNNPKPIERELGKIIDLIKSLQNKQKAIAKLKQQYKKGIDETKKSILNENRSKGLTTYQNAQKEKRVELYLRMIQRRLVYITELDRLLDQLVLNTEELLYLKRQIEIDMLMVNIIKGLNSDKLTKRIDAVIQHHMHDADKLTLNTIDARPQSLESIWNQISKSDLQNAYISKEEITNHEIWQEICDGNFDRKHELTALSPEAAKILSEWQGKDLFLSKLVKLSPEAAKYLSKWKGKWLSLNGLSNLSPEAAKHLSQWKGSRLSLNGLKKMSPEVVEYLSQWQGEELELVSLRGISHWEESGKKVHLAGRQRK